MFQFTAFPSKQTLATSHERVVPFGDSRFLAKLHANFDSNVLHRLCTPRHPPNALLTLNSMRANWS